MDRVRAQLPRMLQEKLKVSIRPGAFNELPTAMFEADGRVEEFDVQENGLISDEAVIRLCVKR